MDIPSTQHAIQFTGADTFVVNPSKPVHPIGPTQRPDQGLVRLVDLADTLPHVAARLRDGLWTREAEAALLSANADTEEKS